MKQKFLINAKIIDPSQNLDEKGCVVIDSLGKIKSIGSKTKKTAFGFVNHYCRI